MRFKQVAVAFYAIESAYFAVAQSLCAAHKGRAFQASSPKKTSCRPFVGGFFLASSPGSYR